MPPHPGVTGNAGGAIGRFLRPRVRVAGGSRRSAATIMGRDPLPIGMRSHNTPKLAATTSEAEVVSLVLDYLGEWHPEELARIPRRCRPDKRIRDAEDIADVAIGLTNARIAAQDPDPLLVEMETFFAHACTHLSHLEGRRATSAGESARD